MVTSRGCILPLPARTRHCKAVWQYDLPQKTKFERYDSLVVSKGIWGLRVLFILPEPRFATSHTFCQNWYEETERLRSLLRRELQLEA